MLLMATLMEKGIVEDKSNMNKYYKVNYSKFQMEQRLSISQYNNRVEEYMKDHRLKLRQRKIERNKIGYKKSGWTGKAGTRISPLKKKRGR
jgi:hypothetical protein